MNAGFTLALELVMALLLIAAAIVDARTLLIPNRISVALAVLAPLLWWAQGIPLWPDVPIQLGVALLVFAGFALLFQFGWMGGGDVKLAAALALCFTPPETLRLIVWMALAGGLLTLVLIVSHRLRGADGRPSIPYGIAIAAGGLAILAQRFLNQFA